MPHKNSRRFGIKHSNERDPLRAAWLAAAAQRPEIDRVNDKKMTPLGESIRDLTDLTYCLEGRGSMGQFLEERFPETFKKYAKPPSSPSDLGFYTISEKDHKAIRQELVPQILKRVNELLAKGANPNAESDYAVSENHSVGKSTPLYIAYVGMRATRSATREHQDIITSLLKAGASSSDHTYEEMLYDVLQNDNRVREYGNSTSKADTDHARVLNSRIENARPIIVAFLNHGADPHQKIAFYDYVASKNSEVSLLEFAKAKGMSDVVKAVQDAVARQQTSQHSLAHDGLS